MFFEAKYFQQLPIFPSDLFLCHLLCHTVAVFHQLPEGCKAFSHHRGFEGYVFQPLHHAEVCTWRTHPCFVACAFLFLIRQSPLVCLGWRIGCDPYSKITNCGRSSHICHPMGRVAVREREGERLGKREKE